MSLLKPALRSYDLPNKTLQQLGEWGREGVGETVFFSFKQH
jgi:hypothetical protein